MTVVSNRELCITEDDAPVKKRVYYEPDEDFYRSVTIDELKEKSHEFIHKLFANNESNSVTRGRQIFARSCDDSLSKRFVT